MVQKKLFHPRGAEAAKIRKRKYEIIRRYRFAEALLPGALSLTYRRCGKPTCHCATDEGHPMWALSFSLAGKKQVHVIPQQLASELGPLVKRGSEHREALAELMRLNAELLRLWLAEQRSNKAKARARRSRPGTSKRSDRR